MPIKIYYAADNLSPAISFVWCDFLVLWCVRSFIAQLSFQDCSQRIWAPWNFVFLSCCSCSRACLEETWYCLHIKKRIIKKSRGALLSYSFPARGDSMLKFRFGKSDHNTGTLHRFLLYKHWFPVEWFSAFDFQTAKVCLAHFSRKSFTLLSLSEVRQPFFHHLKLHLFFLQSFSDSHQIKPRRLQLREDLNYRRIRPHSWGIASKSGMPKLHKVTENECAGILYKAGCIQMV